MSKDFSDLGLHPQIVQTVANLGYTDPTPIQEAIIPIMLTGQDVIGQAQTGTGKTAAFSLPVLNNLVGEHPHVQCLVLAPTRELAMQVSTAMYNYGKDCQVSVLAVYGGQPYSRQINRLKKGVDIVIGTPGRLLDLIRKNALDLSEVSTVVLDEADEMLSMGFVADIEAILDETPSDRQTALFSATLPREIRRLADKYMTNPQACTMKHKQMTVDTVEQRHYLVNERDKLAALTRLFEIEPISSAIIFAKTRLGTGQLANELSVRGFPAEALNGDMSQDSRVQVLRRFRDNQVKVLVATDVAARGLDIDHVSHVFNYDLPLDSEVYVHRIGRTGRAGKTGVAISLLTPKERYQLRRIESYTKQRVARATLPTTEEILAHRENDLMEQMTTWLRRGRCRRERELIENLVAEGHDIVDVAATALKLARAEEKQRPIAPVSEVREQAPRRNGRGYQRGERGGYQKGGNGRERGGYRRREREQGMVRLALNTGSMDGVQVNHIVGTLARQADIPGNSIGKIRIQEQRTLVDIPEQLVKQVLSKTGRYRIGSQYIQVERA